MIPVAYRRAIEHAHRIQAALDIDRSQPKPFDKMDKLETLLRIEMVTKPLGDDHAATLQPQSHGYLVTIDPRYDRRERRYWTLHEIGHVVVSLYDLNQCHSQTYASCYENDPYHRRDGDELQSGMVEEIMVPFIANELLMPCFNTFLDCMNDYGSISTSRIYDVDMARAENWYRTATNMLI